VNTWVGNQTVTGHVLTGTHNTYSLGATGTRWVNGYFEGAVYSATRFYVDAAISSFTNASFYRDATYGTVVAGITGTTSDSCLTNNGGTPKILVLTTTGQISCPSGLTSASGLAVTSGTTAVQALTCTTVVASSSVTCTAVVASGAISGTTGTFTGLVLTPATAAVAGAGFRLPHGTAPDSPTNGDLWTTTAGVFARLNGATATLTPGYSKHHGYAGV
jgi:hypothetical protein